jgi:hypothetical protein
MTKSPLYAPFDDTLSPLFRGLLRDRTYEMRIRPCYPPSHRLFRRMGWEFGEAKRGESAGTNAIERFSYERQGLAEEAEGGIK